MVTVLPFHAWCRLHHSYGVTLSTPRGTAKLIAGSLSVQLKRCRKITRPRLSSTHTASMKWLCDMPCDTVTVAVRPSSVSSGTCPPTLAA